MEDYDESELTDETEDQYEDAQELGEEQLSAYSANPMLKEKSDIYNWFWKVVKLGRLSDQEKAEGLTDEAIQLSKVGNLNKEEIGQFNTSVRDCLNLANLGKIFGHRKFGDYWQSVAMITTATSMAKKGWFMDLSISQKKVRERTKGTTLSEERKKWRLFGKKQQVQD